MKSFIQKGKNLISKILMPNSDSNKPKVISTLEELDIYLQNILEASKISDDKMREEFQTFVMKFPFKLPADPYSIEYAELQFKLYKWLAGKEYNTDNEVSEFDIPTATSRPFPYMTQSPQTVGNQMIATGFIIKSLENSPPAKILEFGPGWGNTTIAMARMGYEVTAIDIEENFIGLISDRAKQKGLSVNLYQADFLEASKLGETFDHILFFECFHHCANHIELIKSLDNLLNDNGSVLFAAEPITESLQMPWGIRMDGESLWAVRKMGWLELGFQESYFIRTLMIYGWVVQKRVCQDTPWGTIFIAKKSKGFYQPGNFTLPPDEDSTWAIMESDPNILLRFSSDKSEMTLEKNDKYSKVKVLIQNYFLKSKNVKISCGSFEKVFEILPSEQKECTIDYDFKFPRLTISTKSWYPIQHNISNDERLLGVAVLSIYLII